MSSTSLTILVALSIVCLIFNNVMSFSSNNKSNPISLKLTAWLFDYLISRRKTIAVVKIPSFSNNSYCLIAFRRHLLCDCNISPTKLVGKISKSIGRSVIRKSSLNPFSSVVIKGASTFNKLNWIIKRRTNSRLIKLIASTVSRNVKIENYNQFQYQMPYNHLFSSWSHVGK